MISLSTAQLDAWIAALIYPLARILAFTAAAPVFSNAALPRRVRLLLGLALTVAISPVLPPMPNIAPASGQGLWVLLQQMLIGMGMGFAMRLVYAAVDFAGQLVSTQMGLGFATFYDPQNGGQTGVVSEFFGLMALLLFFAFNGHLVYFATLAKSFQAIPVGTAALGAGSWLNLGTLAGKIFSAGLLLALPAVVALLVTNIAMAVLNRAAPQLNLFAIGFPVTMAVGFGAMLWMTQYLAVPLQALFEEGLTSILDFALPAGA